MNPTEPLSYRDLPDEQFSFTSEEEILVKTTSHSLSSSISSFSELESRITSSHNIPNISITETATHSFPEFIIPTIVQLSNTQSIFPMATLPNTTISPLYNMPMQGSKQAPKTFKGKYKDIDRFIKHYKRLLDQYHIITEPDKCNGILEYCSEKVKDFIESSEHFKNPNWPYLEIELLKYYDAE